MTWRGKVFVQSAAFGSEPESNIVRFLPGTAFGSAAGFDVVLEPGDSYTHTTALRFGVE